MEQVIMPGSLTFFKSCEREIVPLFYRFEKVAVIAYSLIALSARYQYFVQFSGLKGILYPLNFIGIGITGNRNHIETACLG